MTHFRQSTRSQLPAYQYAYGNKTASGVCLQNIFDYSPFGAALDGRTMQGDGYRYSFQGQEHDDEVKGDGNSYDFGARMYDARVGRWWSTDPSASKYPNQNPYNFSYNSPIFVADFNGRDGIATIEGNEIVIHSTIYFYYGDETRPEVTKEHANNIAKNIEKQWNDANGQVTVDGKKYNVKFEITGIGISKEAAIEKSQNVKEGENFVALLEDTKLGNIPISPGNSMPANHGKFNESKADMTKSTIPAHEYSHSLGMDGHPDQDDGYVYYDEETQQKSKTEGVPMIATQTNAKDANGTKIETETRKVTKADIDRLNLPEKLSGKTKAVLGEGGQPKIYDKRGDIKNKK